MAFLVSDPVYVDNPICVANPVFADTREETGDHPGDHKLLTCKDAPADIQVTNISREIAMNTGHMLSYERSLTPFILYLFGRFHFSARFAVSVCVDLTSFGPIVTL